LIIFGHVSIVLQIAELYKAQKHNQANKQDAEDEEDY